MDKISEFFKELRDRFSNPLFFSFIVGWLAFNWKIIIGLFFYSVDELNRDGYSSYFDLITKTSNPCITFYYPFAIALLYTFVFPVVRNWIGMFNAWNQKWGNNRILNISKEGKISVSRYVQLRTLYENRKRTIEEVLEKEAEYLTENDVLKKTNSLLDEKLNNVTSWNNKMKDLNDVNLTFQGSWLIKLGKSIESKRIIITDAIIFENDNLKKGVGRFRIIHIAHNSISNYMIIVFEEYGVPTGNRFYEAFYLHSDYKHLKNISTEGRIMELRKEDM